jgi:hypothetical protein
MLQSSNPSLRPTFTYSMLVPDSMQTPSWPLLKAQHAAGKRYEWNVTEPDVHISGNTAWIAYVNKGSVSDASGTKPEMVGIGLPGETEMRLEDRLRLHVQHPH